MPLYHAPQVTPNQALAPFYPLLATGAATIPHGANNAQWAKLPGLTIEQTVTKIRCAVTTQSGNMDVGIYSLSGSTLTRLASSGSTAVPAAGAREITIPSTVLRPGVTYYLAIGADNVTAQFRAITGLEPVLSVVSGGDLIYSTNNGSGFPLPATVNTAGLVSNSTVHALVAM